MGPRLSSIGTKLISATWLVTASCRKEAEQVILNDPVDVAMEIVEGEERYLNLGAAVQGRVLLVVTTWREDRVRVVTAFEPIKRLIPFYYQERER
jgi:uncharacterized DUF497 family protein